MEDKRTVPQGVGFPKSSTLSLNSTSSEITLTDSSTSVTPLVRRAPPPQKDYNAAMAILQSRYGTGGGIPSPKKKPSNKLEGKAAGTSSRMATSQTPSGTPTSSPSTSSTSVSTRSWASRESGSKDSPTSSIKKKFSMLGIFRDKKKAEVPAEDNHDSEPAGERDDSTQSN
ncbi:hypothetical protein D9611_011055 [Ephemerocybe angulata]|uniref:Uncharacterized protein n=1 Tax=Ephemerocybe angulata TaxID=980116 RepID=A0A8H5F113_9AGAR|nr:hypothetical protein D9611_011055 [Tulosesus angulatus]